MTLVSTTKSKLVFSDLTKLYDDLNNIRRDRASFRVAFESYLFKSQQLTEVMRSEFRQMTGLKWEASKFKGWNNYTSALKKIRNAAAHGSPIALYDLILSVYPNVSFTLDRVNEDYSLDNRRIRLTETRAFISDPFEREFSSVIKAFQQGNGSNTYPLKEFVSYELRLDIMGINKLDGFESLRLDVIKLLLHSYPVLKKYYALYEKELNCNLLEAYKSDYFIEGTNGGWVLNPKYQ